MPNKPNRKLRPWQRKREKQQRAVDMSWYYNDRRWRSFSKAYKQSNPFCVKCESIGKVSPTAYTDHIQRLRDGGGVDLNNLKPAEFQALCVKCHAIKSGKEAHGYKEKK